MFTEAELRSAPRGEVGAGPQWLATLLTGPERGSGFLESMSALVGLLFQPSVDGLSPVLHVTANPVAEWAVPLVPPAVQGVNGDAQHFRYLRERHQLVSGLECHDHLPFVDRSLGRVWAAE